MDHKTLSRKNFLSIAGFGTANLLFAAPVFSVAQQPAKAPVALDPALVHDFVLNAHANLDKVKELFKKEAGLLNASWDWGGGDFETAMEAAGHMGRKDIAQFLLDNGGRINLFCSAMLGKLDIVKSTLTAFPDLKDSKGPHGLQLIHHATKGGEDAKAVLDYLKSIGAK